MGLYREDGTPKLAAQHFHRYTPGLGVCQWIHFEDHRLTDGIQRLRDLGVKKVRTGLSWADSERPDAERWFDTQMKALEDFDVTVTYCYTPERCGVRPHHTSPPKNPAEFADFCLRMTRLYA
jgi:beta-xylosidase